MEWLATELYHATFWVAIALLMFLGLVLYLGAPKMITGSLDQRIAAIRAEIDEASKLREDAQALLASYQRKQKDAEKEAEEIVEQAKKEAELFRQESVKAMQEQTERRTRQAESKIAQAEMNAVNEVRSLAASIAIQAAESVLKKNVTGATANSIIDQSIQDLGSKLN